jgi:hypothetical protein
LKAPKKDDSTENSLIHDIADRPERSAKVPAGKAVMAVATAAFALSSSLPNSGEY